MEYRNRILVVDDDIALLEQMEQILDDAYSISVAKSGEQAIKFLSNKDNWVDLILLDVMMPEMDGYETLQRIRQIERFVGTPVIYLTSQSSTEAEVKGILTGAEDYITKPYSASVLTAHIELWLRKSNCLDGDKLAALPQPLSEMELMAAIMLAKGYTNERIAGELCYTLGSTKNLILRLMNKLDISHRSEINRYTKSI